MRLAVRTGRGVLEAAVVQLVERPQHDRGVLVALRGDGAHAREAGTGPHRREDGRAENTTGLGDEHAQDVTPGVRPETRVRGVGGGWEDAPR